MIEFIKLVIGTVILVLGVPIGDHLAKQTNDELKAGQKWFKRIVILSLTGVLVSIIAGNDALLFAFAFIAIVTSRSLKK